MRALALALGGLAVLYAIAVWLPIDPQEQRPGTRLSGEWVEGEVDWSFLGPRQLIYVQTHTWYRVPHSVTTAAWTSGGELYVPCGWCDQKRWPRHVAADPNVVLKIGGKLYARRAVRIDDRAEIEMLLASSGWELPDGVVVYRMVPRS